MAFLFLKESLKFQNVSWVNFINFYSNCWNNVQQTSFLCQIIRVHYVHLISRVLIFLFKLIHYDNDLFVVNFYYYFHPIYCFLHFYLLCSQQPFKQNSVHFRLHGDQIFLLGELNCPTLNLLVSIKTVHFLEPQWSHHEIDDFTDSKIIRNPYKKKKKKKNSNWDMSNVRDSSVEVIQKAEINTYKKICLTIQKSIKKTSIRLEMHY